MKTKLTFLLIMCISIMTFAQNGINYKAIVKDNLGNVVANDLIQVQFSILAGATSVYQETHSATTDNNGIVIINIGEGTPISGSFIDIDWASDDHFLNVQINTGAGLTDMGTTQFKTVPYALSSGDKVWNTDENGAHVLATNIGIGTETPSELLEVYDVSNSTIKLTVPNLGSSTKLEFENGDEAGTHTFYRFENRSDYLRFEVDTDFLEPTIGYETIMNLGRLGLSMEIGTRINEFSADVTLNGNSDNAVPTERAVKTYVDNSINAITSEKSITIPATDFTGNQSDTHFVNYRNYGAYAQMNLGNGVLLAPLIVPEGSTITSIIFYLRDESSAADVNLECTLLYGSNSAGILTQQFSLSTFGGSTSGIIRTYNTPFVTAVNRKYIIRIRPTSAWGPNDFGVSAVKVTYTD